MADHFKGVLRGLLFLFLTAVTIAALVTVSRADWAVADMNYVIDTTNVKVNRGCSGTVIDMDERLILTAHHCVETQYKNVERETIGDNGEVKKTTVRVARDGFVTRQYYAGSESVTQVSYRTSIKAIDKDRDLAIVQVKDEVFSGEAAQFACTAPQRGERVYVVGNPAAVNYSSVTTGIVSSNQRDRETLGVDEDDNGKLPLMQVSAGVVGGNSGGAVYTNNGALAGVPVLAHGTNEVLGYAVPLNEIKAFLKANGLERLTTNCK
jgi:S1-C subfamily serine protease